MTNDDLLQLSNDQIARDLARRLRLTLSEDEAHLLLGPRHTVPRPVVWLMSGDGYDTVLDIMALHGWTYMLAPIPGSPHVTSCAFIRPDGKFDLAHTAMHPHRGRTVAQAALLVLQDRTLEKGTEDAG